MDGSTQQVLCSEGQVEIQQVARVLFRNWSSLIRMCEDVFRCGAGRLIKALLLLQRLFYIIGSDHSVKLQNKENCHMFLKNSRKWNLIPDSNKRII